MSHSEAKFIADLIKSHGSDYKVCQLHKTMIEKKVLFQNLSFQNQSWCFSKVRAYYCLVTTVLGVCFHANSMKVVCLKKLVRSNTKFTLYHYCNSSYQRLY